MGKLQKVIDKEFININLDTNTNGHFVWDTCVGKECAVKYNGEIYNIKILSYNKEKRSVYIRCNEKEYNMTTSNLIQGNIGLLIGYLTTNFKYNVGDIINGYRILSQERTKKKNGKTYRSYNVECIKDGYKNNVSETGLEKGYGCPVCNNKVIVRGINDMWTTNPELASLLASPNDGYKYSQHSKKKVDWKCPHCHSLVKNKEIDVVARNNYVPCPFCGDGFSYPEKMMSNILAFLDIEYIQHYRIGKQTFLFDNKPYRPEYDFYFELCDNKYIIEMDGGFHNIVHSNSKLSIEQINEIDNKKDILAKENDINLIRIDCKFSDYDYIFNSIKNSTLNNLFDLSKINKTEINKKAYSSNIVDACNLYMTKSKNLNTISKLLNIPYGTIYKYLQKGAEIGLCDYDPKFSNKYKGNLDFVGTYIVEI